MVTVTGFINTWGNGAALRITKPIIKASGIDKGACVTVTAEQGRIVIEAQPTMNLAQMLEAFDPQQHGGEAMAWETTGKEQPA